MLDTIRTVTDILNNYTSLGVLIHADAKVQLARPNLIDDPNFFDIEADGSPHGTRFLRGLRDDGYHAYAGKAAGDRSTLSRQTFFPLEAEEDSYPFNREIFAGAPVTKPGDYIINLANQPEKGWITFKSVSRLGYDIGEYWACITQISASGRHTMYTEPVRFTVLEYGAFIEFPLLSEVSEGTEKQGLWLSQPAPLGQEPDQSTITLQETVRRRGATHTLFGPLKRGRPLPERNETQVGTPKRPEWGRPRKRDIWRDGNARHDLQAPLRLNIAIVEVTERGPSLASPFSETRQIDAREREIPIRHKDGPHKGEKTGETKTVLEPIRNESVRIRPNSRHPDSKWYRVFARVDDAAIRPIYELVPTGRMPRGRGFRFDQEPPEIYGYKDDGSGSTGGGALPKHLRWVLVQGDPPEEDESGIENPTGESDPPRTTGGSRPAPGWRWFTYTRFINGRQSLPAPPIRANVPADMIPVLHFPPLVNKIPNSTFRLTDGGDPDVGQDAGVPTHWIKTATGGAVKVVSPGTIELSITGSANNNNKTPSIETEDFIAVNSEDVETLRGTIHSDMPNGRVGIGLVQYTQDGTLVSGTEDASTLILGEVSVQNQELTFTKRVGSADAGTELAWHADTTMVKPKIYVVGNPRSGKATIWSLAWHPFDGAPRKIIQSEAGSLAPSIPTTDAAVPFPTSHVFAIMRPPEVQGSGAYYETPIAVEGFEGATLPTEYTSFRSVSNADTEAGLSTASPLTQTKSVRVRSDRTSAKTFCYVYRDMTIDQWKKSGGGRVRIKLTRGPTYVTGEASIFSMLTDESPRNEVAGIYVRNVGSAANPRFNVNLKTWKQTSKNPTVDSLATNLTNGTILDVEIISGYGDGKDNVSIIFRAGTGSKKSFTVFAGNLPGNRPERLIMGVTSLSDRRIKYTFDYDDLVISVSGRPPDVPATPALTPLEQPNWPMKDAVILNSTSGTIDYAVSDSATRRSLAVEYDFTPTSTATGSTQLVRLDDSTNTLRAELVEVSGGAIELRGPSITTKQIAGPSATNIPRKLEVVFNGGGSKAGSISVYSTTTVSGQTTRNLMEVQSALDYSSVRPLRVRTFTRTGLTANGSRVSDAGVLVPIDADLNGLPVAQFYMWINPFNVLSNSNIGMEFLQGVVRPGVEHCFSIRAAYESAVEGCKPFNVVLYDLKGNSYIAARVFGDEGTASGSEGWLDRPVFFTPDEGYHFYRIENEDMLGGIFIAQQPFMGQTALWAGGLATEQERDEARAASRSTREEMRVTLRGTVPGAREGVMQQDYEEEWLRLIAYGDTPAGVEREFSVEAATNIITCADQLYSEGGTIRFKVNEEDPLSTPLPTPLAEDTTYFIRDIGAGGADTFRISATYDDETNTVGSALDITQNGSGLLYGVTSVEPVYRSSDQEPPVVWSEYSPDPMSIPQDQTFADVFITMRGDGEITPTISPGQIELLSKQFQPTLLRADGSAFNGGTVVGNLLRDYEGADLDTTPVAGQPRRRQTTDPIRRIEQGIDVDVYDGDTLVEIQELFNDGENFQLVWPAINATMLIEPYDMEDPEGYESELFEETIGFVQATIPFTRAKVLESHDLIPELETE